ncbi:MAG: ATP synthase F0 subunit B [Nitrospirota bacterium]|nr:ATP synthase F0 subunit B [Nitrospirota bacterium]
MLELNKWFFVQLANFLILLFLLNILLFRPLLNLFKERKENIDGAIEEAKRLNEKKDEELARFNKELSDAREKAKDFYNSLRQEGLLKQKEMIAQAQAEALKEIDAAQAEIRRETEKVRRLLGDDVRRFSEEIVEKLIEVEV